MRSEEDEAILAIPPVVGVAVVGIEPATPVVAVETENARDATGTGDRLVHDDEPIEAHLLNLLVRDRFPEERGDFGRRRQVATLLGFGTNLRGNAVIILELFALDDDQLVGLAGGRDERGLAHHVLRPGAKVVASILERLDELLAGAAFRGHVADNHVADHLDTLAEGGEELRPDGVVAKHLLDGIRREFRAMLLENRTEELSGFVDLAIGHWGFHGRGHDLRHGVILL